MTASVPMIVACARSSNRGRRLEGVWKRNFVKTDMAAMEKAMSAMRLGKFQKMAALKLIDGLEIGQEVPRGEVSVRYLTKLPGYSMEERFREGETTTMPRRDQRSGPQRAVAQDMSPDEMLLKIHWDGELPGRVEERFVITHDGQLEVRAVFQIQGKETIHITQVYDRLEKYA